METSKKVLGAEHPNTLTSMANLANTWKSQGKMQDALTLMTQCSYLRNIVLGPSHTDSMSSSRALNDWIDKDNALIKYRSLWRKVRRLGGKFQHKL